MNQKEIDVYWLREAFKFARDYSQDANSQTGTKIINPFDNSLISSGANRMHYGLEGRFEGDGKRIILGRPDKYTDLTHAERDAVFSANRLGIPLDGTTLYATWTPCKPCAEVIINNGIKRFVTHESTDRWYREARQDNGRQDWTAAIKEATDFFAKANVEYVIIDEFLRGVEFLFDDKMRTP